MRLREIFEDGRIVKGVNTTTDVGPNEIKTQAAKFGNTVDKDGVPPTLSKRVKGKSTNVLFNLGMTESIKDEDRHPNERPLGPETKPTMPAGTIRIKVSDVYDWYKLGQHISDLPNLDKNDFGKGPPEAVIAFGSEEEEHKYIKLLQKLGLEILDIDPGAADAPGVKTDPTYNTENIEEGYKLQLERDNDLMVLHIIDTKSGKRTEVRGKGGYETSYDANDKLHQLLDRIGKTANVSELINGEVVTINPNHPDAERAKKATDVAYNENFAKDSVTAIKLIKKYHQTGKDEDAFAAIKHGWNFIKNPKMRSIIVNLVKKVSTENGYPNWDDTVAYIKKNTGIDVSNVNENFADGKVKGKSRPGRVKRSGASCNGSVTALRKRAKSAGGEKAKMYHWCANMKSGKKK